MKFKLNQKHQQKQTQQKQQKQPNQQKQQRNQKFEHSKPEAVFQCSKVISKTGYIKLLSYEGDINKQATDHPWFHEVQLTVVPFTPNTESFTLDPNKFTHTEEELEACAELLDKIEEFILNERS